MTNPADGDPYDPPRPSNPEAAAAWLPRATELVRQDAPAAQVAVALGQVFAAGRRQGRADVTPSATSPDPGTQDEIARPVVLAQVVAAIGATIAGERARATAAAAQPVTDPTGDGKPWGIPVATTTGGEAGDDCPEWNKDERGRCLDHGQATHAVDRDGNATRRPWWHAFGRVRLLDPADEHSAVWQLVVVSPSTTPPEEVAATVGGAALDAWGDYLASWDHEPTDDEKEAVTPDEFRDDDACPDDGGGLHHSGCGCPDVDPLNP